eukprot:scaffold3131_cov64-Attheya_sp.AAC.1
MVIILGYQRLTGTSKGESTKMGWSQSMLVQPNGGGSRHSHGRGHESGGTRLAKITHETPYRIVIGIYEIGRHSHRSSFVCRDRRKAFSCRFVYARHGTDDATFGTQDQLGVGYRQELPLTTRTGYLGGIIILNGIPCFTCFSQRQLDARNATAGGAVISIAPVVCDGTCTGGVHSSFLTESPLFELLKEPTLFQNQRLCGNAAIVVKHVLCPTTAIYMSFQS